MVYAELRVCFTIYRTLWLLRVSRKISATVSETTRSESSVSIPMGDSQDSVCCFDSPGSDVRVQNPYVKIASDDFAQLAIIREEADNRAGVRII